MRVLVLWLILAATALPLPAQTTPSTSTVAPTKAPNADLQRIDDFRQLFEERERLVEQLKALEKSIDELSTKTRNLPSVETLERDLARAKRDLEKHQKAKAPDPAYLDSVQRYIETTTENLDIAKSAMPLLLAQRAEYDRAGRRLFALEQRIASLFDASRDVNKFRTNVTFTFGVLVFIVIVGFYVIAWYKQGVATTIFSGAMGMQFVTLFLIVIAIILFGIMGTLEGKELAALLGGLSGYILGRAESRSSPVSEHDVRPTAPEEPAA